MTPLDLANAVMRGACAAQRVAARVVRDTAHMAGSDPGETGLRTGLCAQAPTVKREGSLGGIPNDATQRCHCGYPAPCVRTVPVQLCKAPLTHTDATRGQSPQEV